VAFTQFGDEFTLLASVVDANNVAVAATRAPITLTVPPDVSVLATIRVSWIASTASTNLIINSGYESDQTPTITGAGISFRSTAAGDPSVGLLVVRTNTTRQVFTRAGVASSSGLSISTFGWNDRRGRDD